MNDHHFPCPCGAELADECPKCARSNPFGSMRLSMSDPSPAQRADWFTTQHEATATSDARYGRGHRPTYAKTGAGWTAACTCGCDRGYDRLLYPTWDTALDAAKTNLAAAEHGEAS